MNLKHFLRTLTFLLAVMVTFTACQKEEIMDNVQQIDVEILAKGESIITLPVSILAKNQQDQLDYLQGLSYDEFLQLEEHAKISLYLRSVGLFESVSQNLIGDQLFSTMDMSYYLTPQQLIEMAQDLILNRSCDGYPEGFYRHVYVSTCNAASGVGVIENCGPVSKCSNGAWEELVSTWCYVTSLYCDPATHQDACGQVYIDPDDAANYCNSGYQPLVKDPVMMAKLSETALGLSASWKDVMRMYITHSVEINKVLREENSAVQNAVNECLAVNKFIIVQGIKNKQAVVLDDQHIASIQKLVVAIEKEVATESLKVALNNLSTILPTFKGEKLQEVFTTF